jgi:hypothetical protein
MSDAGDSDFSIGDLTPIQAPDLPALPAIDPNDPAFQSPSLPAWGIQAPDISPNIDISSDDSTYQAPSIMGGVDFSGNDLPMRGQTPSVPWTVQSGGLPQPAMPSFQGGSRQPVDQAAGIGKAMGWASNAVNIAHGVIGAAGKLLPGDHAALNGLPKVTTAITAPLDFGAGTGRDIGNGANPAEAVLGNGIREGLVLGAGAAGDVIPFVGGPAASWVANHYLPDGAAIGHGVIQVLKNPPDPKIFPVF